MGNSPLLRYFRSIQKRSFLGLRREEDSDCTRYASAERHEGDGIDRVLKVDEAAQVTGHIADDGGTDADHADGDHEARVAVGNSCRG